MPIISNFPTGDAQDKTYGTCATAAATAAKVVTMDGFKLEEGASISVKFTYANTASSPTLDVNSTGAASIKKYGTTAADTYMWNAGAVVAFSYDGTNWVMEGGTTATTTYYGLTKLSTSTSSTSTTLAATPSAVKAAYDLATTANTAASTAQTAADDAASAAATAQSTADGKLDATGTAASATKLATARTISLTGDVTGSASFDGSANASVAATLASSGATAGSYGPTANVSPAFGGTFAVPQVTVDAKGRVTSAAARTITVPSAPTTVSGNAGTATKLATARAIQTNLASTSSASFDGSADITPGVTGTLPITNGGTGNTTGLAASATKLATARTIRTNLASTSTASFNGTANITPGVTGILPVENGGTGVSSLDDLKSALGITDVILSSADSTLNNNTWSIIHNISSAGVASSIWSVGDCKSVELSGTVGTLSLSGTYWVYIIGFDHNSTYEGTGIHFQGFKTAQTSGTDICLVDSNYNSASYDGTKYFNMNHWGSSSSPYNTNYGGWSACDLRYDILGSTDIQPSVYGSTKTTSAVGYDASTTCATSPVSGTLMAALPSDLRAVMKPMTKYQDNTGNSSNTAANVTATIDYLPLLAEFEIFGTRSYANTYEQNYQAQYAYYSAGNSKVKYRHSSTSSTACWWERSPYYGGANYFCYVGTDGNATDYSSRYSRGLAPAFKV